MLLLDMIKKSNGKVINLSSLAASRITEVDTKTFCTYSEDSVVGDGSSLGVSTGKIYSRSKLANLLFTKKLNRELSKDSHATSYACHPGVVRTNLARHLPTIVQLVVIPFMWYVTKSPLDGAQTTLHLALSSYSTLNPGNYYADCKRKLGNPQEDSFELQDRLWETSLKLCKDYLN